MPIAFRPRRADLTGVKQSAARAAAVQPGRELSPTTGTGTGTGRLKELKRNIERDRYDVNAGAVAEAILEKLRLVRQGRLALAEPGADRSLAPVEALRGR
jgi:anti-sigma28 factor (negative regulator of flagellin synthesis)